MTDNRTRAKASSRRTTKKGKPKKDNGWTPGRRAAHKAMNSKRKRTPGGEPAIKPK